jgi:hypothetical protein
MKKTNLFLGIAVATFALTACSNDDTGSTAVVRDYKLFTSSNTSGKISITDLATATPTTKSFTVGATDADGIFYNPTADEIIQASRTNTRLDIYNNIKMAYSSDMASLNLLTSSAATDFSNPREIAVSGDTVIVTQDQSAANGLTNKLMVYKRTASGLTLFKSFTVNFKLWGIHYEGTTLYAVADATGDLVSFSNFIDNADGAIIPTKRVTIEGLVRTHGITYSATDNLMVLTDVGDAASATDGGIITISNFTSVFNSTTNGGMIAIAAQKRIYGPNSLLGNPVDVAYDSVSNSIFIAERLNGGGQVLTFDAPTTNGDVAPDSARAEAGVSAVYLLRR